jgi:hypothetical protein
MNNVGPWKAFAPDGVTPSTELSLSLDSSRPRPNSDPVAGRVSGTANALNHSLRRSFAALDLSNFDEFRLWVYSNRIADGAPARPFFLEMTLASATLALDDPANKWRRLLPVSQAGVWEPVRLSLSDLDAKIRGALTQMRLRCVSANTTFQCDVDDIIAVRDEMLADVDAALAAQLNNVLIIGGNAVPAIIHPGKGLLAPVQPYFSIINYNIVYSRERTESLRPRSDFTDTNYSLSPQSNAYELFYKVTAVAADRATQSQMLEFALRALPSRGEILVNGFPLPMESVVVPPFDNLGRLQTDNIALFYRISTRQETGTRDLTQPAKTIIIDGDLRA